MCQAIIRGFELGILKKEDYIDSIIKEEALIYSEKILKNVNNETYSKEDYAGILMLFLSSCDCSMAKTLKKKYTRVEKKYLTLKFKGITDKDINRVLKLSSEDGNNLRKCIFSKLKVNDWFNSFKKAFQLKIIKKESYLTISNLETETNKTALNILLINSDKKAAIKEKQLLIYQELLQLYGTIEFKYLSKSSL